MNNKQQNLKEHDCDVYFEIDRDPLDYEFFEDIVRFYGHCSECEKKGHEVFVFSSLIMD